jgi:nucleotide-binding universal stress UspA family protein
MLSVSSILWPSDGSEASFKALEAAVAIADKFGARLYALQVVHQVPTVTATGLAPAAIQGFDVPMYEQELVKTAEKGLHEAVAKKVGENVEVESQVKIGVPEDIINEFVQENDIGLIVMATHRRTGLNHFMLGSVAEKTIRQSSIPTLIIPTTETSDE